MIRALQAVPFFIGVGQLLFLCALLGMACFILIRGRKTQLQLAFVSASLLLAVWLVTLHLMPQPESSRSLLFLMHLGLNGTCLALVFCSAVFFNQKELSPRVLIPIALPLLLAYLLVLSSPLHRLFSYRLDLQLELEGPIALALVALQAIYLFVAFWLFLHGFWQQMTRRRIMPLLWLFVALGYAGALLSLLGLWPAKATPLFIAANLLAIGLLAILSHAFDLTPLARRLVMNEISYALAITRTDQRLLDVNLAMQRLLDPNARMQPLMPIERLSPQLVIDPSDPLPLRREIELETATGRRMFEMSVQSVNRASGSSIGLIYRLVELDQDQQMRRLLAEQNKHLSMANQSLQQYLTLSSQLRSMIVRNQIAREMHDSLGHTLIVLISVLEKYQNQLGENQEDRKLLQQAGDLIVQAQGQLSIDSSSLAQRVTGAQTLADLIDQFGHSLMAAGLRLETQFRGDLGRIPESHWTHLLQVCREAMTNTMKHSRAQTIHLFLIVEETAYRLIVLDDGQGTPDFAKGFGLQNMQKRLEQLEGTMRLSSDASGFGIFARVPLGDDNA